MAHCPLQLSMDALNTATPNLADLVRSTGRSLCLKKYIDALNTATPNLADIYIYIYIYVYIYIYIYIYIYQCTYTYGRLTPIQV